MPLQCRCPICRGEIEIEEEHVGGLVKCPHCGISINPAALPKSMTALDDSEISESDTTEVAEAKTRARLLASEHDLRSMVARGDFSHPAADLVGRRVRRWTLFFCLAGILLALGSTVGVIAAFRSRSSEAGAAAFALILIGGLGLTLGIGGLFALAGDLSLPMPAKRTTPLRGLAAFLGAMRSRRFEYAWHCMLPGSRSAEGRRRPSVSLLGLRPQQYSFSSDAGMKDYWLPIMLVTKTISHSNIRKADGDLALASCRILMELSPRAVDVLARAAVGGIVGVLAGQSKQEILALCKLLRRVDGQWYVVNGEIDSPEDHAFDEAVRISKLSDSELKTELAATATKQASGRPPISGV